MRDWGVAWLGLCAFIWCTPALAGEVADEVAQEASETDVAALEGQLDELSALISGDCDQACRALELMARAADRICALEPGERCDRARRRVADASRRVHEACPECEHAHHRTEAEKKPEDIETPATDPAPTALGESMAAPPAEDRGAGCAACALGAPRPSGGAWLLLLGLAAWLTRRRR